MPLIKIDDHEMEVEAGSTILEVAKSIDKEIPHYCYHPGMSIVASCRMCLVKVQGMPKLTPACSTRIGNAPESRKVDGKYDMVISTADEEVKTAQESVLEFLLLNHPVDCPECDQAGECFLQDYSFNYGKDKSRFEFSKRVPARKDLGPNMLLISTRCILCSRCVRFTNEISGTNELMVRQRGYESEIDLFPGQDLDNKMSMNTADICPVGALVSKDFLFKPRNWRYNHTESICPGCSVGCNIRMEHMEEDNRIYRIKPTENPDVNQWWMCDDGRLLYHAYHKLERLEYPQARKSGELQRGPWRMVLRAMVAKLREFGAAQVAVVGSGYASNEENWMLQSLARQGLKSSNVALNERFPQTDDIEYKKFVIKGEKLPNYQGALDMLDSKSNFADILKKIDAGEIKALYYLDCGPDYLLDDDALTTLKKLDYLVVQDIKESPLSVIADVILPGASAYEKDGTFTNYQNRVQRIRQAIIPPAAAKTDFEILQEVCDLMDMEKFVRPQKAFTRITETVKDYAGMDYKVLGTAGMNKGRKVEA